MALAEAKELGAAFGPGALDLLLARVGTSTRLLIEETRKLATYVADRGAGARIEEGDVAELTPNVAEGDFFEAADAFGRGDLKATLAALERHFFTGGEARGVIAALQNRNRLLLQVRALVDSGEVKVGPRGLDGMPRATAAHGAKYAGASEKNAYNIFTQNPWYLGKLASTGALPPLRRLIDNQLAFVEAFEEIVRRPDDEEAILRDMAVRCLAPG